MFGSRKERAAYSSHFVLYVHTILLHLKKNQNMYDVMFDCHSEAAVWSENRHIRSLWSRFRVLSAPARYELRSMLRELEYWCCGFIYVRSNVSIGKQ